MASRAVTVRHADAFGGRAVGFLSMGNLSVDGSLLGQLAGMITAVWQTNHGAITKQCILAKWHALPMLAEPVANSGDARFIFARSSAAPYFTTGFNTGSCNDWRARVSGTAGGIPPTPS